MKEIILSVIIPVYNSVERLERCVSSVLENDVTNVEVLLIDDGSTDGSSSLCDVLQSQDERIKVIHQTNSGVSAARNVGIDIASGFFLAFVDSDDYIESSMYKQMIEISKRTQGDCVCCGVINEYKEKSIAEYPFFSDDTVIEGESIFSEMIVPLIETGKQEKAKLLQSPCNKIYRTSIIKDNQVRFSKDLNYAEDYLFNINYFRFSKKCCFLNNCLYHYDRTTPNSLSKRFRDDGYNKSVMLRNQLKIGFLITLMIIDLAVIL